MTEQELLDKILLHDAEAFRQLVQRYQRMVFVCAYKFLRNTETAEDITQEVFLEVFRSLASFKGGAKFSTWLYRITVTKCLNQIKAANRKKRFGMVLRFFGESGIENQISVLPDDELIQDEHARQLHFALNKIPENQRTAFTLCKIDGMSYEEIARIMDTSIPSVESLLFRAKKNLQKHLHEYYKQDK